MNLPSRPATTKPRHVQLVRLGQGARGRSYEQTFFASLSEHASERVRREWREAGLGEAFEQLQSFLRDSPPSLEETAGALGESVPDVQARIRALRVDWLEALAEELEAVRQTARSPVDEREQSRPSPAEAAPTAADTYEVLDSLGADSHGSVYRARHCRSKALVALKVLEGGPATDLDQFHTTFQRAQKLRHPNILPIEASGVIAGRPCFSMELIDSGTLADAGPRARFSDPEQAVRLVITIARAVQYAHEHGVLHLNLKPSNVLIDSQGEPRISDFSLLEHGRTRASERDSWLAPEQRGASDEPLSTATDVFGLGAILRDLLGFDLAPRPGRSGLGIDLAAVCLTALEPVATNRYRTAAEFADDLERVLAGRPTFARPPGVIGRIARWRRRHPLLAAASALAMLAMIVINVTVLALLSSQQRDLIASAMKANATLASLQARHTASVLDGYAQRVAIGAADPAVIALAELESIVAPAGALAAHARGFDSVFVLNTDGYTRARWPDQQAPEQALQSFAYRDYFKGADPRVHGGGLVEARRRVYLSRVFRSHASDRKLKFAFSAPLYAENGRWVGVLVATRGASATLENIPIELYGGQATALLAPRDRHTGGMELPDSYSVILHDELEPQREEPIVSSRVAARLRATYGFSAAPGAQLVERRVEPITLDDYADPVPGHEGRWVAGFAPVASTGYVIAVGTPYRGVSPLLRNLTIAVNAAFVLLLIFIAVQRVTRASPARQLQGQTARSAQ